MAILRKARCRLLDKAHKKMDAERGMLFRAQQAAKYPSPEFDHLGRRIREIDAKSGRNWQAVRKLKCWEVPGLSGLRTPKRRRRSKRR